jgi:hypothetical protein
MGCGYDVGVPVAVYFQCVCGVCVSGCGCGCGFRCGFRCGCGYGCGCGRPEFGLKQSKMVEVRDGNHHGMWL